MTNERNIVTVEREIGGKTLTLETGRIATQADGSVVVRYGDTMVLVAATQGREKPELGFFPLYVDYRERPSAAGKFPGGFFKREGRPGLKEVVTARMIDRPHRPLFPDEYYGDIAVYAVVQSADTENDPDVLAMIGGSAALHLAPEIPFLGPTGSIRIGKNDGELNVLPTCEETEEGTLDLVVSGTKDAVCMVDCGAWEIPEEEMAEAIIEGHEVCQEICEMIEELREKAGLPEKEIEHPPKVTDGEVFETLEKDYYEDVYEANQTEGKMARSDALDALEERAKEDWVEKIESGEIEERDFDKAWEAVKDKAVRTQIVEEKTRTDGRGLDEVRDVWCEVGYLPRAHGSAIFTRGETQALVTTTLGTSSDEKKVDGLREAYNKRFYLHYNFPAYCVGETWPNRGPRRRSHGHGFLAERAIRPVLPEFEKFPYTVRIVSDITESNGSSSMATVSGGTLSLMDAGVPIEQPVGGVAMGLIKTEDDEWLVLTDLTGTEDHAGDMDFKVAGTQRGITAIQLDVKIEGLTREVLSQVLEQAKEARTEILRHMLGALSQPRKEISPHAPRLVQLGISSDKIGNLIGPGGRNIRSIQESTNTQIEIDDLAGTVTIAGVGSSDMDKAFKLVRGYTEEVEEGKIYDGKVVTIKDFGAFIEVLPGQEGLCHVSELDEGYVDSVDAVLSVGDMVKVKCLNVDSEGKIKLSKRAADEELGTKETVQAGDGS